jgi:hypothetical protein
MWVKMAQQHISPEVTVKGFKKCCISSAVRLMMIYCGMTVMLGVSVRKMKALTMKMERIKLNGKSR